MAGIIKEYAKQDKGNRFIIRRDDYGNTLSCIVELRDAAERDFDSLDYDKVDIIHYGGERYKGTFGIEFNLNRPAPEDYEQVAQVEFRL